MHDMGKKNSCCYTEATGNGSMRDREGERRGRDISQKKKNLPLKICVKDQNSKTHEETEHSQQNQQLGDFTPYKIK